MVLDSLRVYVHRSHWSSKWCGAHEEFQATGARLPLTDVPGNTIVLGVTAPGFVPELASVMLLASGLMGLAGYAGLRLRKR